MPLVNATVVLSGMSSTFVGTSSMKHLVHEERIRADVPAVPIWVDLHGSAGPLRTEYALIAPETSTREVDLLEFRGCDSEAQTAVTQPANSTKPVPR